MGDVIRPDFKTTLDIPADQVLESALRANPTQVIIIGLCEDGPYYASSTSDVGEMFFRMEMFKQWLINDAERRST